MTTRVTTREVLATAVLVVAGCLLVLAGVIGARRGLRLARERRRTRRVGPLRPLLIAVAAADEPDPQLYRRLRSVSRREWREVEVTLAGLLGKVRGESRAALAEVLAQRGTVARARRRSRRPGAVGRARAAELLGSTGAPGAAPELIRLLRDRDPDVRIVAARALGRAGVAAAAGQLLRALQGKRTVPASVVAYALLQLGPRAELTLVVGTHARSALVRGVAVEVLGLLGATGALAPVLTRLERDSSVEVQVRAARALGRIGLPAALRPLLAATQWPGPEALRAAAAGALGDLGDPAAVPRLVYLLGEASHRVASAAEESLLRLGQPGRRALARAAAGTPDSTQTRHAREALARGALTGQFVDDATLAEVAAAAEPGAGRVGARAGREVA